MKTKLTKEDIEKIKKLDKKKKKALSDEKIIKK